MSNYVATVSGLYDAPGLSVGEDLGTTTVYYVALTVTQNFVSQ